MYDDFMYNFDFDNLIGGFLGSLIVFVFIILLLLLISNILIIVAKWKLLKQAGKDGWEALIPIYNKVVFCDIVGLNPWWILVVTLSPLLCSIPILGVIVSQVIIIYFNVIYNMSIAKSYGKEEVFGIGLWLLPPVFWLILAFGNTSYVGKNGIDPILKEINKSSSNNNNSNKKCNYCPRCGEENIKDANYCKKCGTKL